MNFVWKILYQQRDLKERRQIKAKPPIFPIPKDKSLGFEILKLLLVKG